jgi:hypothetical protein
LFEKTLDVDMPENIVLFTVIGRLNVFSVMHMHTSSEGVPCDGVCNDRESRFSNLPAFWV